MSELRQLPARLDLVRAPGDDVTITVTVTDGTNPVNLTTWTLAGEGCDVTITDAPAGVFTVVPTGTTVGSRPWRVTRTAPDVRSLLAGSDRVSEQSDRTPGDVDLSLQLVDGDAVVLSITGGGSGSGGVTVHGDLTGLDADDHPHYLRVDSGAYVASPPEGGLVVFATEDTAVADANPDYVWLVIDPLEVPATPTGVSASAASDTEILVTWLAVLDAASYDIRVDGGSPVTVGNITSYLVEGLDPNTTYDFEVRATNSAGESAWSSVAQATTQAEPTAPDAPTTRAAPPGDGQVSLTWTPSADAVGHSVYRGTTDDFQAASQIVTDLGPDTGSYTDTTAVNGTTYYFWVVAYNSVGVSDPSASVQSTPGFNIVDEFSWHSVYFADEIEGLSNDDDVTTWPDLAGNEHDLVAESTAATFIASSVAFNDRAVVNGAGGTVMTTAAFNLTSPVSAPWTLFFVGRRTANSSGSIVSGRNTANNSTTGTLRYEHVGGNWQWWGGTNLEPGTDDAGPFVAVGTMNGENSFIRLNGNENTGQSGSSGASRWQVFGGGDYELAFLGAIEGTATQQQIDDFESWATDYYDIEISE